MICKPPIVKGLIASFVFCITSGIAGAQSYMGPNGPIIKMRDGNWMTPDGPIIKMPNGAFMTPAGPVIPIQTPKEARHNRISGERRIRLMMLSRKIRRSRIGETMINKNGT